MNFLSITANKNSTLRPPGSWIHAFKLATNSVTPLWEISISGAVISAASRLSLSKSVTLP